MAALVLVRSSPRRSGRRRPLRPDRRQLRSGGVGLPQFSREWPTADDGISGPVLQRRGPHFFLWKRPGGEKTPFVRFEEVDPGDFFDPERGDPERIREACHGWTLALGAAHLDGDGLPEVYISNDLGPDRLLHNRSKPGELRFALLEGERGFTTPRSRVLGRDSFKGMGIDFGDVNGDGRLDMYVSNLASPYSLF